MNLGHRKRARNRYQRMQIRTVPDYELLQMLLYHSIPRSDTKPLALELLARFKSLGAIINASELDLKNIEGLGEACIFFFKLLQDLISRIHLPIDAKDVSINGWGAVMLYCRSTMAFKRHEEMRVLYLNKRNNLLFDEVLAIGTIDKVIVYPRIIATRALEKGAAAVIIAHNHPSNDLEPSREDIDVTKLIKQALAAVDVNLLDHLLVTDNDCFSFKANMLL